MRMKRTWNDNIASILRDVFFPCEELKELLMIPEADRGNIQVFADKYFINDPMGEEQLTDEKARVLYYATEANAMGNPHVKQKLLAFDIFVRRSERYTASDDGLRGRDKMIVQVIQELLTDNRYVGNMRFTYEDDYELGTKVVGFIRHHIVFSYKTSF